MTSVVRFLSGTYLSAALSVALPLLACRSAAAAVEPHPDTAALTDIALDSIVPEAGGLLIRGDLAGLPDLAPEVLAVLGAALIAVSLLRRRRAQRISSPRNHPPPR